MGEEGEGGARKKERVRGREQGEGVGERKRESERGKERRVSE